MMDYHFVYSPFSINEGLVAKMVTHFGVSLV